MCRGPAQRLKQFGRVQAQVLAHHEGLRGAGRQALEARLQRLFRVVPGLQRVHLRAAFVEQRIEVGVVGRVPVAQLQRRVAQQIGALRLDAGLGVVGGQGLEIVSGSPVYLYRAACRPSIHQERNRANIARIDPFNDLVDDLFKGFFVRPVSYGKGLRPAEASRSRVDVTESETAYVVSAELTGVKKEDIQVAIDGAQVTLSADVKREKEAAAARRQIEIH